MNRDRTYRIVIRAFRVVFTLLGLRFTVRGAEKVPARGPVVLACNHVSYLDFAFVGLAASRHGALVRFMAKQAVFANPVSGPLMRAMGHIPVDRADGAGAYRKAIRALERDQLVCVFPEATISRAWVLRPFKRGAAGLSVRQAVPLVPVVVWGGHRVATTGPRVSLRRGRAVTVLVGDAIHPGPSDTVDSVNAELRVQLQNLLDTAQREYPDRPGTGEDPWWLPRHLGGTAPTPAEAAVLEAAAIARRAARS